LKQGAILFDLVEGERSHVCSGLPFAIPADKEFEGLLKVELRVPAEVGVCAARVELKVASFVRVGALSRTHEAPLPQKAVICSAIQATGRASVSEGPKL
jgi:hypothetical protein